MKPTKELQDIHRRMFHAAQSQDAFLKEIASIFEDVSIRKKLPGIIIDIYFQSRVSMSPMTHVDVYDSFVKSLELCGKKKKATAYSRALVQLALDVLRSSPKRYLIDKVHEDPNVETERLLMAFDEYLVPTPFEDRLLAERNDYSFIKRLRLMLFLLTEKKSFKSSASVMVNLLQHANNSSKRKDVWDVLTASGHDYTRTTINLLTAATSSICPDYHIESKDSKAIAKTRMSMGRINVILWTIYYVLVKGSTDPKKPTSYRKRDSKAEELHQMYFPSPDDAKKKMIFDMMSYIYEPVYIDEKK